MQLQEFEKNSKRTELDDLVWIVFKSLEDENTHEVGVDFFDFRDERVSQKLSNRFERVDKEFYKEHKVLKGTVFGERGFRDVLNLDREPRQLVGFGVTGLLTEDCHVYYEDLFSTKHAGRVSDLLSARLKKAGADEFKLRSLLIASMFESYRVQISESEWTLATESKT